MQLSIPQDVCMQEPRAGWVGTKNIFPVALSRPLRTLSTSPSRSRQAQQSASKVSISEGLWALFFARRQSLQLFSTNVQALGLLFLVRTCEHHFDVLNWYVGRT